MAVVDASAMIDLLLNRVIGQRVRERLFASADALHAPHLIDIEVLHVLRHYNLHREVTDERAEVAVALFRQIPIERHSHEVMADRVWALRRNLSAYDAAYVALAEMLGAPLITTDRRLANAAPSVAELIH